MNLRLQWISSAPNEFPKRVYIIQMQVKVEETDAFGYNWACSLCISFHRLIRNMRVILQIFSLSFCSCLDSRSDRQNYHCVVQENQRLNSVSQNGLSDEDIAHCSEHASPSVYLLNQMEIISVCRFHLVLLPANVEHHDLPYLSKTTNISQIAFVSPDKSAPGQRKKKSRCPYFSYEMAQRRWRQDNFMHANRHEGVYRLYCPVHSLTSAAASLQWIPSTGDLISEVFVSHRWSTDRYVQLPVFTSSRKIDLPENVMARSETTSLAAWGTTEVLFCAMLQEKANSRMSWYPTVPKRSQKERPPVRCDKKQLSKILSKGVKSCSLVP